MTNYAPYVGDLLVTGKLTVKNYLIFRQLLKHLSSNRFRRLNVHNVSESIGRSKKTVRSALEQLEQLNLIEVNHVSNDIRECRLVVREVVYSK